MFRSLCTEPPSLCLGSSSSIVQPLVAISRITGEKAACDHSQPPVEESLSGREANSAHSTPSYPQLLEVGLDLRRQFRRLFVEVGQFGVDVSQRLLEIEVLVLLRRRHAHVAAGREAPVGGFNLLAVHQLHQPRDGLQLGVGKAVLQPRRLPVEIDHALELLDGGFTKRADRGQTSTIHYVEIVDVHYKLTFSLDLFTTPSTARSPQHMVRGP